MIFVGKMGLWEIFDHYIVLKETILNLAVPGLLCLRHTC